MGDALRWLCPVLNGGGNDHRRRNDDGDDDGEGGASCGGGADDDDCGDDDDGDVGISLAVVFVRNCTFHYDIERSWSLIERDRRSAMRLSGWCVCAIVLQVFE